MKKFLLLFFALFAMTFFAKAQTPVLSENFENGIPTGWTQIDANNDNYVWEHSSNPVSYHNSGVNLAGTGHNGSDGYVLSGSYSNASGQAITPDNWLITPSITLNGAATLSFWVCSQDASYSAEHYGVYISTTDNTNTSAFTLLQEWTIGQSREQTAWENHTVNLSAYNGETVYIAFRHFNCNDEFILNLDDVTITVLTNDPTIVANPTSLTMPTLLGLPASATVQIDGYNLTSTITASTNAPFEVSSDGTNFGATASLAQAGGTLYVKYTPSAAGTDNGTITLTSGTTTVNITVTGTAIDCNLNIPYTETFEATSTALSCWTTQGNGTWSFGTGDYSSSTGAFEGSTNALITHSTTGNVTKLISPILVDVNQGLKLDFAYVMRSWAGDIDELRVYFRSDANSAWQQMAEFTDAAATWTVETVLIPGTVHQIAFEMTDNYGYGVGIDSVVFTPMTADYCFPVNNLTASNVFAREATLNWEGEASSYNVYEISGGTNTLVQNVTNTSIDLTNLTPTTNYTYGVTAICGSEESDMVTVTFTTQISCPVPTGLNVTYNPNEPTEVTLSWTENGTATEWQIVLNGDTTNIIDVYDNPYTLTDLVTDSIYTVMVRANCDIDDQSVWSPSVSFEPTTKTVIGSGNTTSTYLPTYCFYNYSLTEQIYTVAELGDAGLIESIDFFNNGSSALTRDLSIYMVSTTKDTFASATDWISANAADLQYSGNVTFAPGAWTTITLNGFIYDGLSNVAIIVDDNTGTYVSGVPFKVFETNKQALRVYSDGTNYEVTAPAYDGTVMNVKNQIRLAKSDLTGCIKPTGVTINYTGGLTAEVSWTSDASSFNIDVNGTVTNNVTSPYTLTDLTLGTTYTVSLQAECDATSISDWTNPISFTTDACMPEDQCTITIEGTDSFGDGWNGNAINIMQGGAIIGNFTLTSGTSLTSSFNVCSGIPVSFSWVSGNYPSETSFEIHDGGNTVVFTGAGSDMVDGNTFFTLNNACPSCLPATGLTVDDATETSITISWTGTAASYDIYNGEDFVANVTTTTYTFNGLTASTGYVFGVQAICSATDSAMIATISVATACVTTAINLPFTETFDLTSGSRDCWTTIDADNDGFGWTTLTDGTGADQEAMLSYSYDNGTYAALNPDNWLVSPKLHSNAGSTVTMQWTVASAPSYPAEHYGVYVSTTVIDTNAFTMVDEWTISNGNAEVKNLDLSAYAGQDIYVAFRHHNCTDQYVLMIDDVQFYEGSYVPDTLTVTFAVNNAAMGTTNPVPGTYQYIAGDTVSFNAVANAGYHFVTWEYTLGSSTTVQTFDAQSAYFTASTFMSYGNVSFTAIFEAGNPDSTTITYAVNDATMGTTTPAPGTYTIYVGDNIQAAATPNAGYELTTWILDYSLNGTVTNIVTIGSDDADFENPITFGTVPQSFADAGATFTVTAVFAASTTPPTQFTVTLISADTTMGTVTPAGTTTVDEGSSFTATATALEGYRFVNWTNDAGTEVSTDNPYTFTVTEDITLIANFELVDAIEDITLAQSINLMPNPADNYIELRINSNVNVKEAVVYNAFGQMIQTVVLTDNHAHIDLSNMASGMYFVRVNGEGVSAVKKFIKR